MHTAANPDRAAGARRTAPGHHLQLGDAAEVRPGARTAGTGQRDG